jgi:hypothetical protein
MDKSATRTRNCTITYCGSVTLTRSASECEGSLDKQVCPSGTECKARRSSIRKENEIRLINFLHLRTNIAKDGRTGLMLTNLN